MAGSSSAPPAFVRLAAHPVRWQLMTELATGDLRVRELVARVDQPQNLVSYHLRLLRDGGLVRSRRSSFDGRDSYYSLDLTRCADALVASGTALHPSLRMAPAPRGVVPAPVDVLFVCTGNSARSPIAELLLRRRAPGGVVAASAGTLPKPRVHPHVDEVLTREYGIDAPSRSPRDLSAFAGRRFDLLVTLCDKAREAVPELAHVRRRIHWSIPDPASDSTAGSGEQGTYASFARTAADLDARIRHLLPTLTDDTRRREST